MIYDNERKTETRGKKHTGNEEKEIRGDALTEARTKNMNKRDLSGAWPGKHGHRHLQ